MNIEPYNSIGNIKLDSRKEDIDKQLSLAWEKNTAVAGVEFLDCRYSEGITISYKENHPYFIGVMSILNPTYLNFEFSKKNYNEIVTFLQSLPGKIYFEHETSLFSEYLGVSIYFEDGVKEIGIFGKDYLNDDISNLPILKT